jgi:hypothetical protein
VPCRGLSGGILGNARSIRRGDETPVDGRRLLMGGGNRMFKGIERVKESCGRMMSEDKALEVVCSRLGLQTGGTSVYRYLGYGVRHCGRAVEET